MAILETPALNDPLGLICRKTKQKNPKILETLQLLSKLSFCYYIAMLIINYCVQMKENVERYNEC